MIIIFNLHTLVSLIASLGVALGSSTQAPKEPQAVAEIEVNETDAKSEDVDVTPEIKLDSMFSSQVESQINEEIEAEKDRQEASGESNTTITSTQETIIEKEERDASDAADAEEEPKESENQAEPNEVKVDSEPNVDIDKLLKKIDLDF